MGRISNAGIWIDCKQLLNETYRISNQLTNRDRLLFGDKLIQFNLDMISNFALAYSRGDEHLTYDNGNSFYDVTVKGLKMEYVDKTLASFECYKVVWEFIDDNLTMPRTDDEKQTQTHRLILEMLGKIESGLIKWKNSLAKQVVLSKTDRAQL